LLMLVAFKEHQVWFETGYGLEGTLPDGYEARVVRNEITPRFRENDYTGGIEAGVLACASRIGKEMNVSLEWDGKELRYDEPEGRGRDDRLSIYKLVFFVLLLIVFGIIRSRRRGGGGWWWLGPGGGGYGGGWGGGFGGGSGGGGGGFGGFGGGSS